MAGKSTDEPTVEELMGLNADTEEEEIDNSRTPRDLEERDSFEAEMDWQPARMLPAPNESPDWDYRYVRIAAGNDHDNVNHSQALRDRWQPVMAKDVPEIGVVLSDVGAAEGTVVLGGMLLCRRPKAIGDRLRQRRRDMTHQIIDSVDRGYLKDQNEAMQKFSEKSTTTSRRRPSFGN